MFLNMHSSYIYVAMAVMVIMHHARKTMLDAKNFMHIQLHVGICIELITCELYHTSSYTSLGDNCIAA